MEVIVPPIRTLNPRRAAAAPGPFHMELPKDLAGYLPTIAQIEAALQQDEPPVDSAVQSD
jgi:hypothetical protein